MSLTLFVCAVAALAAPALSQTTTCTGGRVYSSCGSPCNITCANYQNPPICLTSCAPGCFCPQGMVLHNDQCINPSECSVTDPPPAPSCINGKVYSTCGTACPLTCDNHLNPPLRCTLQCVIGCFCPHGLVELGDSCVPPTSCPDAVTAPPTTPPPTPTCTNGKVFHSCGTACPRTCDNHQQEFLPCTRQCVIGCFCPEGMVEMGDNCVPPSACPGTNTSTTESTVVATTVPAQPTCTNGKLFETCGTACPLTCDNYRSPPFICPAVCVQGCFCPHGLVELGDTCVPPTSCPDAVTAPPTTPPPAPTCTNGKVFHSCGTACPRTCDNHQQEFLPCTRQCVIGCFCPEGMVEMGDNCVPPSACPVTTTTAPPVEPACINGKIFETCGTACPLTCDNYLNPPTGCIDECVEGCFCPQGLVQLGDTCVAPTRCPERVCPNGMEYRECGPLCPYNCDSYFGKNPCFSLRCGPGGCFCPDNHVMADGHCTPAEVACQDTKPTPVVNPSPVRLEVKIRNTPLDEFMNQEGIFLTAVKNLLSNHGYGNVQANVHSITQDEHLVVVIQLNGDSISAAQAQELASLLSDQSSAFTLEIVEVNVTESESDDSGAPLSTPATIGIAVGASVLGLVLVILLSAILVVCVVNKNRRTRRQDKYRGGTELDSVGAPQHDFTKDKLVRESLSH